MHTWSISTGSHVQCFLRIGNFSVPEVSAHDYTVNQNKTHFYFSDALKRGYAQITKDVYAPNNTKRGFCPIYGLASTYTLALTCHNSVTSPVPTVLTYVTFELPISGFQIELIGDLKYFRSQQQFCIEQKLKIGSNILVKWDFGDVLNPEKNFIETCEDDGCTNRLVFF